MRAGNYVKLLMTLFGAAYSVVIIPDTVHKRALRLVHYEKDGTWYQADRVCRYGGGYLVLVDGPQSVLHLNQLRRTTGRVKNVFTRMIRHDDAKFYSYDDECSPVDTSSWSWEDEKDEDKDDLTRQCVRLDDGFLWKKRRCDYRYEFVCEFRDGGACDFRMTSVSLISLPVNDASMAVCQATCRQMIGCFATAPSGHATLPPLTHCLFVVTGDDSNPMATFDDCPNQYLRDKVTNPDDFPPPVGNDSTTDPDDCVPRSKESDSDDSDKGDKVLDMLQQAPETVECTTTTIYPTEIETAHVTLTPDVVTDHIALGPDVIASNAVPIVSTHYVTLTPDVMTEYLTLTPDVIIDYVTLTPDVVTVSLQTPCPSDLTTAQFSAVTTTVDLIVPTTVELQLTTTAEKIQTTTVVQPVPTTVTEERLVTMTAVLSQQPCSSAELTVSEITTTEIQVVTETVNAATPALMTETETRFVTQTVTPAAIMVTITIPETVVVTQTLVVTASSAWVTETIPDTVVEAQSQTETATPALITTTVPQSLSSDQGSTEIQPETETTTVCSPPSSVPECPNTTYPFTNKYENKTEEEFEDELQEIVKELKVNPVNVSRSRRKKESAPDERKSAQSLGAVAVGVMVVGVVLLVLVDGSTLFCYIHRLVKVRHNDSF